MSRRALLIEDSDAMRQMLSFALQKLPDLTLEECSNGMEALKLLGQQDYDVILVDINMPLIDGLKIVTRVRASERHANTPIIVVTTETGDKERALSLGANAYLRKPVKSSEVVETVTRLLEETHSGT